MLVADTAKGIVENVSQGWTILIIIGALIVLMTIFFAFSTILGAGVFIKNRRQGRPVSIIGLILLIIAIFISTILVWAAHNIKSQSF